MILLFCEDQSDQRTLKITPINTKTCQKNQRKNLFFQQTNFLKRPKQRRKLIGENAKTENQFYCHTTIFHRCYLLFRKSVKKILEAVTNMKLPLKNQFEKAII
jgi:hypothetical protein